MAYKYLAIGLLLYFLGVGQLSAANKKLSEQAQISILIGEPSDIDIFSMFGHAALRIQDPELAIDYVFNYGIPRSFTGGVVNYFKLIQRDFSNELYAVPYTDIEKEYLDEKRSLNELTLNFSQEEKESLWQSLLTIASGGGKSSYYNLLNHNCIFLPLALLEKDAAGTIIFSQQRTGKSYRDYLNQCLQEHPWSSFLLNISLGRGIERPISYRESFFLPSNFEAGLLSANVTDSLGNAHPLIAHSHYLVPPEKRPLVSPFFTPALCAWVLFAVVLLLSAFEWKSKHIMRWIDAILFALAGISGCYLFYIQFIITQWLSFPSWWILWMHPLHLLGAVWSASKRYDKFATYYHIFNLSALSVMFIGTCFAAQYYHPAFPPLMLLLALRSGIRIRLRQRTKK